MGKDADKQLETYPTDVIFVKGDRLKVAIYERTQMYQTIFNNIMESVAAKLKAGTGDGDPFQKAASLMVALEENHSLSVHALEIQSFIKRAAALQKDMREMTIVGRTLLPEAIYELSWEEAEKYGV